MAQKNFSDLFDDFLNLVEENVEKTDIWREKPVDLVTFFKSKNFLNERPYAGKQTELLETLNKIVWYKLTGNTKLCPIELQNVVEVIAMWGKGSGKDFIISGFMAYMAYLLCCMNNPHKYFNFGQDEQIDLINVAQTSYQAGEVFFKKLIARLRNCKWFKEVKIRPSAYNEFHVTRNKIRFYKNITCHSAHSEAESYEGFAPLVAIFDEYGGYTQENARNSYNILKSSAATRFNDKYLLVFISYPRSENCPMYTKYIEAVNSNSPNVWYTVGATWEVNLNTNREYFKDSYEKDPETASMYYECIPPKHSEGLFKFPERIDAVTVFGKQAQNNSIIVEDIITSRKLNNGEERYFVGIQIHNLHLLNTSYTYYIGGDCGVTGDSYVICLGHAEPIEVEVLENGEIIKKWINKPVEDLILEWRPNKKERLPVDLLNVSEVLEQICKTVHVKKALFDKFNSAEVVQKLMSLGVLAEDKAFSNPFQVQIYQNGKSLIYGGYVELLDYTPRLSDVASPNEELKAIKLVNGNKIDHDNKLGNKKVGKDYSDARMSMMWLVSTDEPEGINNFSLPIILGARRK